MNKHFELTNETTTHEGRTLHRIRATRDIPAHGVSKGDLGGFVESTDNLSDNAWVADEAMVYGGAKVYGDAWVSDHAWVANNAKVYGNAQVGGAAQVFGNARVYENALISGNAWVRDHAKVRGNAGVYGDAQVFGNAHVFDDAVISDNAMVFDNALVCDNAQVGGNAEVTGSALVCYYAVVDGDTIMSEGVRVGLSKVEENTKTHKNTRTLADMTHEERHECIGMWCDVDWGGEHLDAILTRVYPDNDTTKDPHPQLYVPELRATYYTAPTHIAPRFDLLRAWNPDGTPVETDQEYGGTTDDYGYIYPEPYEKTNYPPGTPLSRWVTDWKPTSPEGTN